VGCDMNFEDIKKKVGAEFPEDVTFSEKHGCRFLDTKPYVFKKVLSFLKDECDFEYLVDVVAAHWPKRKEKFDVIYNVFSITNKIRVFVRLKIEADSLETVTDLWKSALFLEREQYDLVGVRFEGHPDLRRILMPEYFEGNPLKKDYPLKGRKWFNETDEQQLGISFSK